MRYGVQAQAFSRASGKPQGVSRVEIINTASNILFKGCNSIMSVKQAYESFWNELNPSSEQVVFVQQIFIKS